MEWIDWYNNRRLPSVLGYIPASRGDNSHDGTGHSRNPLTESTRASSDCRRASTAFTWKSTTASLFAK
jgi:hypothetical protein